MTTKREEFSDEEELKLWNMWRKIKGGEYDLRHEGQWATFEGFLDWMLAECWQPESMVMRKDAARPKTPGNCYITTKGDGRRFISHGWEEDFCRSWAKAVNPFRRAAGLEPLEPL